MALFLLQPGIEPLGQFDCLDADAASILGGEIFVLDEASRVNTLTEKAAQDALDGYIADQVDAGDPAASRPVARLADGYSDSFLDATKGNTKVEPRRMFYLGDDGTALYGTQNSLIGNPVGLGTTIASGGTQVGYSSLRGGGKVTLWDKPGTYAVSTDAVAALLDATSGNLNDTPLPGSLLYREHDTGKLTSDSITGDKVAVFIEVAYNNKSLVNTPNKLVGATTLYDRVVIEYLGPSSNL